MDAHFFKPALYSGGIFAVDRAASTIPWQPGFKFFFNFESSPLRLTFPQETCPAAGCYGEQEIIRHALVFNLMAQFGISRWLEFGIDVPIIRQSLVTNPGSDTFEGFEILAANDPGTNIPIQKGSPGDIRTGLKFNILQAAGVGLALAADVTIPFGDEEVFAGEKGFTLQPRALVSFDWKSLGLALNVGYRMRPQSLLLWDDPHTVAEKALPVLNLDDELTYGFGVAYRFHRVVGVGAEVYGAVPVTAGTYDVESVHIEYDSSRCPAGTPAGLPCEIRSSRQVDLPGAPVTEVLGGVIISPTAGLNIAVGAGAGVMGEERRAPLRVFAGISWLPGATPIVSPVPDDSIPSDRDGDGIPDDRDKCPDEPEDFDGFQDEDGCPDLDNDGDGIPDSRDACPNEPEDLDGFQDEDGCPDLDNDGDGIPDKDDKCPNEAETFNDFEDEDGCPDEVPTGVAVGKESITIPEQIRFQLGSAVIDPISHGLLDDIARKILANPQVGQIRIEGHTDDRGRPEANQALSQTRADSVRGYLIRKGVQADRLQAVGYGQSRPIAPNTTAEGRAKNRRVEFILVQAK